MKNIYETPKFEVVSLVSKTAFCGEEDFVNGGGTPTTSIPFFEDEE